MGAIRPTRPETTDGKPKIPLPMMELITSAVRLQRPIVRISAVELVWPFPVFGIGLQARPQNRASVAHSHRVASQGAHCPRYNFCYL